MRFEKGLIAPVLGFALLMACGRGLPPSVQRDIVLQNDSFQDAEREVKRSESALNSNLAQAPDLFRGAAEPAAWKSDIGQAKADLQRAQNYARELAKLVDRNRPDPRIFALLADERKLLAAALQKTRLVDRASAEWLDYKRDPVSFAAKVNRERETVRAFDLTPVAEAVHKAEQDWPAKKPVLESRLAALTASAKVGEPARGASPSILIAEQDALSQQGSTLTAKSQELQSQCGQLYDSWDKVLTDLDHSQVGPDALYRERLKTVRTHFVDVPLKKTETHSEERWANIPEASFHALEDDIGMSVAHKDAGEFDTEAQNTPQPPGFSYVASPAVGSNQYGYWTHNGRESFWTFLPQYLILRELLWNHDYHPVAAAEYNAYRAAQSRGATYYGRSTPAAAPKYGTHGTFTQSHYADSRYVQSGGFKGSAYASGGNSSSGSSWLNRLRASPHVGAEAESGGGKRFGRQPGSAPMGQRFGRAPSSRPSGRSFGRRR